MADKSELSEAEVRWGEVASSETQAGWGCSAVQQVSCLNGEPSEKRAKVLGLLGLIPGVGLIAMALMLRDMAKLDERIARRR